ncbi:unnamed protein product [Calypogeia fissa]
MACVSAVCGVSAAAVPSAGVVCSSSTLSTSSRVRFQAPLAAPTFRTLSSGRFCRVVAMASDSNKPAIVKGVEDLVVKIKESITSAQEVCEGNETSEECVVAWDEVEELSAAASHKRESDKASNAKDPLEKYCEDHPETDECRVYED